MKSITHFLTTAIAATAVFTLSPEAKATDITLDGYGFYKIANKMKYYKNPGPAQSGRYGRLGKGYYHKTTYAFDFITNRDGKRSGDLSFEFWAMPYYGATSGPILMTRGKNPLKGGKSYEYPSPTGQGVNLEERAYPDISVWEYTKKGWKFRDALTFSDKTWL